MAYNLTTQKHEYIFYSKSKDFGISWSNLKNISRTPDYISLGTSSEVFKTENNWLILPAYGFNINNKSVCVYFISKDNGNYFEEYSKIISNDLIIEEPAMGLLGNGSLITIFRTANYSNPSEVLSLSYSICNNILLNWEPIRTLSPLESFKGVAPNLIHTNEGLLLSYGLRYGKNEIRIVDLDYFFSNKVDSKTLSFTYSYDSTYPSTQSIDNSKFITIYYSETAISNKMYYGGIFYIIYDIKN